MAVLPSPQSLVATPGNGQVVLSWAAVPGAVSYNIYRGATDAATAAPTSVTKGGVTSTTVIMGGLQNGAKFFFRVAGVNSAGAVGALSASVNATPSGSLPTTVTPITTPTTTQTPPATTAANVSTAIAATVPTAATAGDFIKKNWLWIVGALLILRR